MNSAIAPYNDVHQNHMALSHHAATSGPPPTLGHYAYQPAPLQSGHQTYTGPSSSYGQYQYAGMSAAPPPGPLPVHPVLPVTTSMSMMPQPPSLPAMSSAPNSTSLTSSQYSNGPGFDTSGQIAPPGMKPRVTATLWEDEGSLCFQVEAKGVCVARREDNHMINGTKLLNVAGMTRGRRDGILKSEKTRHVVKIGPMHLKGVWIPFERALEFANKEKITEALYPLFVHDIGALLYHPTNNPRPGVPQSNPLAVADRRRDTRFPPTSNQSLVHHHSMGNAVPASQPAPPHSLAPHPPPRPLIERAATFPTPPASATGHFNMGSQQPNTYEWNNGNSQSLNIDTGLSNARNVPTPPVSTPPISGIPSYSTSQAYDNYRPVQTAPASQPGQYQMRYPGQAYPKSEMAPPPRAGEGDSGDVKSAHDGLLSQSGSQHPAGDDEAEHDQQESDHYYSTARSSYQYPNSGVTPISSDVPQDNIAASPHQNGSGRATPRTASGSAPQWAGDYSTPARNTAPAASSNVYSVMEPRSVNGGENYVPLYTSMQPSISNKRGRDEEDDEEADGKRQKTAHETNEGGPVGGSPYAANRPRATAAPSRNRRPN
ncbi:apses-domain-containing protein [Trichodelitschia bisporula]|uniref:Apses-domain-containing protein n=1 Tax=Trichodelitschia bisporula TaxID=703511 RepID=A0A6G1I3A5_9PEZI|nr:apses-domain-containing protein [Trichodelitschia bisporula]